MLDGPMDGYAFLVYIRNVLAPTLRRGEVVILDNLPAHKVSGIREAVAARRAQLFCRPPYSPDLNSIAMAFAKLQALLRQNPARTVDTLISSIGQILDRFHPTECANLFEAAGYQHAM